MSEPENESENMLATWNALVKSAPKAAALITPEGSRISRSSVDETANEIAEAIRRSDILPNSIILLQAFNGPVWISSFIGILRSKCVCVPVESDLSESQVEALASNLRASMVVKNASCLLTNIQNPKRFRDRKLVLGKMTSGSSGAPKTFYFTSSQIISDGKRIARTMGITPKDINLGLIPWGHSYGLGNIVMPLLIQGTPTTWTNSPLPSAWAPIVQATQATVFPSVPTVLKALAKSDIEPSQLASLKLVISAGARLDPEIALSLLSKYNLRVHNFYGSSETGGICYDRDGSAAQTGKSVGTAMPGVSIHWTRGDRFFIESDSVYSHGNRTPRRTLAADKARIDANGNLVLIDRVKGFAKIGGKRISLAAVETALKNIEGIDNAAAFEISINDEPAIGVAIESKLEKPEIVSCIRNSISRNQRPKRIALLMNFPTTSRGKIDTRQLRSLL